MSVTTTQPTVGVWRGDHGGWWADGRTRMSMYRFEEGTVGEQTVTREAYTGARRSPWIDKADIQLLPRSKRIPIHRRALHAFANTHSCALALASPG